MTGIAGGAISTVTLPTMSPEFSSGTSNYTFDCGSKRRLTIASDNAGEISGLKLSPGKYELDIEAMPGQSIEWKIAGQSFRARCLPADFPRLTVDRPGQSAVDYFFTAPNLTFDATTEVPNYLMVLDKNGVPVWWKSAPKAIDFKLLPDANLAYVSASGIYHIGGFDGVDVKTVPANGSTVSEVDVHDLQVIPSGGYVGIRYVPADCPSVPADCVDLSGFGGSATANPVWGEIQFFDANGFPTDSWSTKDRIRIPEEETLFIAPADVIHMNSVEPDGNGVVFSARSLGAVYRVDLSDGSVSWKLGGTRTAESLTVVGDPHASRSFGGQHDARVVSRNGHELLLSVSDNGTARDRPPRVALYRIDELARTATLAEAYSSATVPISLCCGSARLTENGHWVAGWGAASMFSELDSTGNAVLNVGFPDKVFSYRTIPVQLSDYPLHDVTALINSGMETMYGSPVVRLRSPWTIPLLTAISTPLSLIIDSAPARTTRRKFAVIKFSAPSGTTTICQVDHKKMTRCKSPLIQRNLVRGRHIVTIFAISGGGIVSRTVAWTVLSRSRSRHL